MYVEAALDFPDEDIDFLAAPELGQRLADTRNALDVLLREAGRGKRLMDGLHVVIIGAPNVGKSSLLNALADEDRAIVSDIAGTTRDLLRETLDLDGVLLTLVDTAGLRDAPDSIEAEGIRRARAELQRADVVLAVLDGEADTALPADLAREVPDGARVLWLHNKADLRTRSDVLVQMDHYNLSARTGAGLDVLRARLRSLAGGEGGGSFSARARHLDALAHARVCLGRASACLGHNQAELAAEELRQAQLALGQITGAMDADSLLGRIFSGFCIGK